jgi:hypothetical protein
VSASKLILHRIVSPAEPKFDDPSSYDVDKILTEYRMQLLSQRGLQLIQKTKVGASKLKRGRH